MEWYEVVGVMIASLILIWMGYQMGRGVDGDS